MRGNYVIKVTLTFQSPETSGLQSPWDKWGSMQKLTPRSALGAWMVQCGRNSGFIMKLQETFPFSTMGQLLGLTPLTNSESISPPAIPWQRVVERWLFAPTFLLMAQLQNCGQGSLLGALIIIFHSSCLISGSASSIHKYIKLYAN